MKAIMLMFDSLNRHLLSPYGCEWTQTPNFRRLAERTATFDSSWVCSMPCMPARRDLHTGRPNFLHTGWSPLQPWDDSVPEMLKQAGTSSHLVTDHYHYFEDGGATYHPRYTTWELFRGQEGDPWKGQVAPPVIPPNVNGKGRKQDWINRQFFKKEADFPQNGTMAAGLDFVERNHAEDNWFLQIETFDPHEPFTAPKRFHDQFEQAGVEPIFDWPDYSDVKEPPEVVERARHNYAALLAQCDENLGRLLDAMDRHDMWDDTMLIVWTDHGFLLGEHNRWAKNIPNLWNEISNTPFFVWDPRHPECAGQRRQALVQPSIDLGPTLLRFFGQAPTADMTGHDLEPAIAHDAPVREDAIFGYFGQPIHYTDGRFVYMRDVTDAEVPLRHYNSMPMHMNRRWPLKDWEGVELAPPLPFTKGLPVLRRREAGSRGPWLKRHLLFDLKQDPGQETPLDDPQTEARIVERMKHLVRNVQAPEEIVKRYGLD